MIKQRSVAEVLPSDYYFAVHPVSIKFEREYKTKFHLYFQKGLQIISKHQTPLEEVRKDQSVQFPNPQQIHYFRVQSEKNLDYQWSLYIFRVDLDGDNEEFIEGQKITLKDQWKGFKQSKNPLFQKTVRFNSILCKLNFVVIIGNNKGEISDLVQKYFNENKPSAITSDQKVLISPQQDQQTQKKDISLQHPEEKNQVSEAQLKKIVQEPVEELVLQKIQKIALSEVQLKNPENLELNFSPQGKQMIHNENLLTPRGQNPKLSNSQLDIGKQIEEKIIIKQNSLKEITNILTEQKTMTLSTEQKNIRLTNSQLLNDKHELLTPIYKQKKVILAFVCLILLIIGSGVWLLSKNEPKKNKNKKVKKSKTK